MSLLAQMIERRQAAQTDLDALLKVAEDESRNLTDEESTDFDTRAVEIRGLDERIEKLDEAEKRRAAAEALAGKVVPASAPVAQVISQPATYRRSTDGRNTNSMIRDLAAFQQRGDRDALERMQRNNKETYALWEKRTGVTTTAGAGGEFAPPMWAIDEYIALARAGRPLADRLTLQTLPSGVSSINMPSIATGTTIAVQSSQNTTISHTDPTTSSVAAPVNTLAGYALVSQQELDQSPINFDEVIFQDLTNTYATAIDAAVITALVAAAGETVTYTDGTPTSVKVLQQVANAIQQVHTNRFLPPTDVVVSPRRWAGLTMAGDSQGRPLVTPVAGVNNFGSQSSVSSQGVVGNLLGVEALVDPSVPTNLGGGSNQDEILVAKLDDSVLFESVPHMDTQPGQYATTLSIVVRMWRYYALAVRYPKAIAVISGTGMIPPAIGS